LCCCRPTTWSSSKHQEHSSTPQTLSPPRSLTCAFATAAILSERELNHLSQCLYNPAPDVFLSRATPLLHSGFGCPEDPKYLLMAAVSISPLPHTPFTMSGRRVPLTSNPNAVNSPYRAVAAAVSKQKRSYATTQREEAYGQPPPAKKQMLESHQPLRTPPRQQSTQSSAEGRVFTRKSNAPQQSAFERKCVAVREKPQQTITKAEKPSGENLETIRQWQKHYRKIFPTFVFYFESFESIPEDVRLKYTKQVIALGAVSFDNRYIQM